MHGDMDARKVLDTDLKVDGLVIRPEYIHNVGNGLQSLHEVDPMVIMLPPSQACL